MATIGTFNIQENGSYTGSITTLNVKAKLTIKPIDKTSEKAPDFRVLAGDAEIGAAWSLMSKENKPYLSVRLDDPSFPSAIDCRLVKSEQGYALVWSR